MPSQTSEQALEAYMLKVLPFWILQDLCKEGYLVSGNKGRWTSYHLNIETKVDTSEAKVDTSVAKVDTFVAKVDTSVVKVDTSKPKVDTLIEPDSVIKRKIPKQALQKMIMSFCDDYKSLDEISNAVDRETSYLQNKILPDMIRGEMLEKKYPHTPNHPGQAYKVTEIK